MSYSTSSSKKNALEKTREVFNQVSTIDELARRRIIDFDIQQMTFQSAIIILCAALEQYLVSFFDDWVIALQQHRGTFRNVPNSLKTFFLMKQQLAHMKQLIASGNEQSYIISADIANDYYNVHNNNRSVRGINSFRDFKFYDKSSFPTEANIKKMFSVIGLPTIFVELGRHGGRRNLRLLLKSFLDIRNAIAHREAPDLTIADMNKHFITVRLMIRILDRILYNHLSVVSGTKFWPAP